MQEEKTLLDILYEIEKFKLNEMIDLELRNYTSSEMAYLRGQLKIIRVLKQEIKNIMGY